MRIVTLEELRAAFDPETVLRGVRKAFIDHANGHYVMPAPAAISVEEPRGDGHIKYGYSREGPVIVIKIATGFYANAKLGLPVNNGLIIVLSRQTGVPLAVLQDEGWLTSWRTAAAGALAASLAKSRQPQVLGIFGAGHQAELQAEWITRYMGIRQVRIWARDSQKASDLAMKLTESGLNAIACDKVSALLDEARLVVTTTPSNSPLFSSEDVHPGTHIVALGADSHGKQELDPELFGRASLIATDDHAQCIDHGDLAYAVQSGVVLPNADRSLGSVLEHLDAVGFGKDDISIVDLTGIAAQDIEIATAMCMKLGVLEK